MKWVWDDDAIKSKLVTQNVAQLMVSKLKRLTDRSQNILKIASCLGASFSLSVVGAVLEGFHQQRPRQTVMIQNLYHRLRFMNSKEKDFGRGRIRKSAGSPMIRYSLLLLSSFQRPRGTLFAEKLEIS